MIDINKKYQTRGGQKVRIYCTDGGGDYPVHGATLSRGKWYAVQWTGNGNGRCADDALDLIEVPETIEIDVWLNVFDDGLVTQWRSKEEADKQAFSRIACIHLQRTVTKGEGLDE